MKWPRDFEHYVNLICVRCAVALGGKPVNDNMYWIEDQCDRCSRFTSVTRPREFGLYHIGKSLPEEGYSGKEDLD